MENLKFSPLVFVMRARDIKRSLGSIAKFPYPKVWVEYYTELQIEEVAWPKVLIEAIKRGHTHIGIFSDDAWASPETVVKIFEAAKEHPVVCGWCDNQGEFCNLTKEPLKDCYPQIEGWRLGDSLYKKEEVVNSKEEKIRTWYSGFSLHVMPVELWIRFPFQCHPGELRRGFASDQHLCWRLQEANIPIVALRDAVINHIRKEDKTLPENKVHVKSRECNIRWES